MENRHKKLQGKLYHTQKIYHVFAVRITNWKSFFVAPSNALCPCYVFLKEFRCPCVVFVFTFLLASFTLCIQFCRIENLISPSLYVFVFEFSYIYRYCRNFHFQNCLHLLFRVSLEQEKLRIKSWTMLMQLTNCLD